MKIPLCPIDDIPNDGTILIPFFGREVHVYQVDGVPKAAMNMCMHFGGQLECKNGTFVCQ